jgi:hypothetical protein
LAPFVALAVVCTGSAALGQGTQIPLPDFARTFSNAGLTRGLWFTSPEDIRIVGLRVPDESGHGLQNIELVRFHNNAPPPTWGSGLRTNEFDTLIRAIGEPSANILAVDFAVRSGEVIGVLGACGDAGTMHNSYGPANTHQSEIRGTPVLLTNMGMQFNVVTTPAQELWGDGTSLARVEIYYEIDGGVCYPDCDGNETLDFFDFLCFQNAFLAGDPYADCDGNQTLDFFDFLCFQNEFLAGCP